MALALKWSKDSLDVIEKLPPKQFKQVVNKIISLQSDPYPTDSLLLKGFDDIHRADIGEYRIAYRTTATFLEIILVD